LSAEPVLAERLASQLLCTPPASDPETVTRRLLAVQAQDPRGARLAIRARTSGLTVRDFDAALASRALLISWLCRGTLHLVCAEDYFWLHDLTTPQLATGSRRRLAQEGVSPDQAGRATTLIAGWLAEDGPLSRLELAERLRAADLPTAGQAMVHILFHATLEGLIVRGPMKGRQHAFVLARDWLGPRPRPAERDRVVAELVRRYLAGHAPASEADIARWAGLPMRDVRAGLSRMSSELTDRPDGLLALGKIPDGLLAPGNIPDAAGSAPPRLLGAFDPLLVGWKDRTFVTGAHEADLVTGGVFRPFILLGGRAGGLWRISGRDVLLEPFAPLGAADRRALESEAEDVRRYLLLGGSDRA
jgi:hypothetical protein